MCIMTTVVVYDKFMISLPMVSMVTTQEGVTALYIASQEGHVTVVRLLLDKGADVNICNKVVMDSTSCTCMWTFSQLALCCIHGTMHHVCILCCTDHNQYHKTFSCNKD